MMTLACWGISFRTASVEQREALGWSTARQCELMQQVLQAPEIGEALVVVTCNRAEWYVVTACPDQVFAALDRQIASLDPRAVEVLKHHGYQYQDTHAIRHFFRVVTSLDAMVVGEAQVTGQVKQAYHAAQTLRSIGPHLHRLCQQAFSVAKRVRHETGIGMRAVSVGSVVVELAEQIFGDLRRCAALILGRGEMAQQIVRHIAATGIGALTLANRTDEGVLALAETVGARTIPWETLDDGMRAADIVLVATAATEPIVDASLMRRVCNGRTRPIFLLDVAVPRNIASAVGDLPDVYLYDIDDLRSLAEEGIAQRQSEVARATQLVDEAVAVAVRHGEVRASLTPAIRQLHQKCETIRREELAKTLEHCPECPPALREAFTACTCAIVAKILHDPILQVKTDPIDETGGMSTATDWLRRLFRLDETTG